MFTETMMDLNLASNWPWLAGGAAAVAAGWSTIRGILSWLTTIVIGQIHNSGHDNALYWFVWNKCSKLPSGRLIMNWIAFNRDGCTAECAGYEYIDKDAVLVFYNWVPIIIRVSRVSTTTMTISYLRGTLDPVKFLRTAQAEYMKRPRKGRFHVTYVSGKAGLISKDGTPPPSLPTGAPIGGAPTQTNEAWVGYKLRTHTEEEVFAATGVPSIDDLCYDDDVINAVSEAKQWIASKEWYREKNIPWRRGWLLTGKPGTGKSTLVKALGKTLDIPVIYFDLSTFLNKDFMDEWRSAADMAPYIALFEDIDAVFNKRENLNKTITGGLTFDCFLNAIAGAGTGDGVFTVITTNDVTKIDPALAVFDEHGGTSRPGRIDRILDLKTMSTASRRKIAQRILKDHTQLEISGIVDSCADYTAAQFTEACVRKALKEKWNK